MAKRYRFRTQLRLDAARHVAGERGVGVAVGADDRAGLDQRQDVALRAVGEIGGVDQAEGGGREHLLPLAAARGLMHQRRGVPFAESDRVSPRARSHWLRSEICVVLPDPSIPSTTISLPR